MYLPIKNFSISESKKITEKLNNLILIPEKNRIT